MDSKSKRNSSKNQLKLPELLPMDTNLARCTSFSSSSSTEDHLVHYDQTSYIQSLVHMIKGNLGTGIMAMPSTFALSNIYFGSIGLPFICLISVICVHLLLKSAHQLEKITNFGDELGCSELSKAAFELGPKPFRKYANFMSVMVQVMIILSQVGFCCAFILFVVDNSIEIFDSRGIILLTNKSLIFGIALVLILPISCIRTLRTLSLVSGPASMIQLVALTIITYLLLSPSDKVDNFTLSIANLTTAQNITSKNINDTNTKNSFHLEDVSSIPSIYHSRISELARAFGSAMFAFEGICIVIPVYNKMKNRKHMGSPLGLANVSYFILLFSYMLIGISGYLKYGKNAKGSISQNLQHGQSLPDIARGLYVVSILMSYPIQLYSMNEVVWKWVRPLVVDEKLSIKEQKARNHYYEYICRAGLVLITFLLAFTIKELRLLMELFGAISGTTLSIILPVTLFAVTFWNKNQGVKKFGLVVISFVIFTFGFIGAGLGTFFSLKAILERWNI